MYVTPKSIDQFISRLQANNSKGNTINITINITYCITAQVQTIVKS